METKHFGGVPVSVLDLTPVNEGTTMTSAISRSVELAQTVEKLGFKRFWLAEHHNMPGIASSATSVLIGHIAGATEKIRVGSGGVMLPNHAPLVIAEQFGTLEAMYPGRIDLGLGRAPGSDQATAYALRRTLHTTGDEFPQLVAELESYFEGSGRVKAFPGTGAAVPLWLLGSSGFSAQLAALKGLPFSFASHFAPDFVLQALQLYHQNFKPSKALAEPYAMVGVTLIVADTQEKAEMLATSSQLQMNNLMRGTPGQFEAPVEDWEDSWPSYEVAKFKEKMQGQSFIIGTPEVVKEKLQAFIDHTRANEVIVTTPVFNQEDRLHSYKLLAEMME